MNSTTRAFGFGVAVTLLVLTYAQGAEGFVPTGSMGTARYGHTATLLPDGRVLVAGGYTTVTNVTPYFTEVLSYPTASAELYNPATGIWTPCAPMKVPRDGHTATVLRNGTVLVVGGPSDPSSGEFYGIPLDTCEIYDPALNTWRYTSPLLKGRQLHAATLLADGRVLVAGGESTIGILPEETSDCEIYDPAAEKWTVTGSFTTTTGASGSTGRFGAAILLLHTGKVLVAGGDASNCCLFGGVFSTTAAEIFSVDSGVWRPTGSLSSAQDYSTLIALHDNTVLIVSGNMNPPASVERYNPATETWFPTAGTGNLPGLTRAVGLDDGRVLVAGGTTEFVIGWSAHVPEYEWWVYTAQTEIFDPVNGVWSASSPLRYPRKDHTLTLLQDGRVLVAGGREDTASELFIPKLPLGLWIQWNQDHPVLTLQGPVGTVCFLESKDDLNNPNWTLINRRILALPRETFVDSIQTSRFYRLRSN